MQSPVASATPGSIAKVAAESATPAANIFARRLSLIMIEVLKCFPPYFR